MTHEGCHRLASLNTLVNHFSTFEHDMTTHLLTTHGNHLHRLNEIVAKRVIETSLYLKKLLLAFLRKRSGQIIPYDIATVTKQTVYNDVEQVTQHVVYTKGQKR